ncbi:hypothetical protein [Aquimarina litoralis]|uniref:hypothetical protein n=1 Tax=Aquimarina litoralis TaxID=584605 RepID=UPI001C583AC0|nr:hypothetical protein [Aquimarina litoralis]MBW1295821.1 hypothetical protein [Aquimarina litoralis]
MKNIVDDITKYDIDGSNYELMVHKIIDPLFEFLKDYIIEELKILNKVRSSFRMGNNELKEIGISNYEEFRKKRIQIIKSFEVLKELSPNLKTLSAVDDLIRRSVIRDIATKIPVAPKDYLNESEINEYDIDWIIRKTKDFFGKFVQTYSSERIFYLLKTN